MPNIAGIKFTKDAKNENRYVTIDLKKHGDAFRPLLTKVGALADDEFEKKWAAGVSGEEVVKRLKKTIANHFKKSEVSSVIFTEEAIAYLDDLISTLLKEEYFSFKETADAYIDDLVGFVVSKISTVPKRIAPPRFKKFGPQLHYI